METNAFLDATREGKNAAWRYLLTLLLIFVVVTAASVILLIAAGIFYNLYDLHTGQFQLENLPDIPLLLVNMLPFLFALIGLWMGIKLLHRRAFITLINPLRRVHWGNLFLSAGLWFVLSALADFVFYLINPGNYTWTFEPARFLPFFLVSLVLIPIQTSTEELVFRGYLTQGLGLITRFWPLVLGIPAILFGLLHGANPEVQMYGYGWMMANYIGIGLLLGAITLRSQSLELALGLHAANNLYAILSTFPGSAIRTPAIFTVGKIDPKSSFFALVIMAVLYLGLLTIIRSGKAWRLAAVVMLLAAGCSPAATAVVSGEPKASPYGIPLEDCRLTMPGFPSQVAARCGSLQVLENRADPNGRKISLRIAVIPAASQNRSADALFLLAGGPGQAASEAFVPLLSALERVSFKRDLVMVDQRGTGGSNRLSCTQIDHQAGYVPGQDIPLEEQMTAVERCAQDLKADTRFYTTDAASQDLDDVRKALGYEQINLLGVSYGTRAALAYLQSYPQQVRSVILDSIVPPGWALGETVAVDAQRALDLVTARCQADSTCKAAFPDTSKEFAELLDALQQKPVTVELPDPTSGADKKVILTRQTALTAVRMMLYSTESTALLPLLIHKAQIEKDYSPLAAQYLMNGESFGESMADGMYFSVICAEDVPFYSQQAAAQKTSFDLSTEDVSELCRHWPHGGQPEALRKPMQSDVPALLLTGAADPVTPPENSAAVANMLRNHLEIILPDMGHNVMYRGCLPKIIQDFLETGNPTGLNPECAQNVRPQPFFLDFAGSKP